MPQLQNRHSQNEFSRNYVRSISGCVFICTQKTESAQEFFALEIFLPALKIFQPWNKIPAASVKDRSYQNVHRTMEKWRQPAGTTVGKRPHFEPCKIHHVDVLAWLRRLRVAPSRTSPISTMHSRRHAFAQIATHNHPTRRDFISARQAGTSSQRIYPAVAGPGMKPISSVGHG